MSPIVVLTSGGLDSAILAADLAMQGHPVQPIYIRSGLIWEHAEQAHLQRFLEGIQFQCPSLRKLVILDLPVKDLYDRHWSITGIDVPDAQSPDAAVYLPGRNLLLLVKGMLWCHLHQMPTVALGVLANNPFPDAEASFFSAIEAAVHHAVRDAVAIQRPYANLTKREVMERGRGMPLQYTFSCIKPANGRHCGTCNKCAERKKAFAAAGMTDLTEYHCMTEPEA